MKIVMFSRWLLKSRGVNWRENTGIEMDGGSVTSLISHVSSDNFIMAV